MKSLTIYVVMTPTGDRPYVSINKPQSYIDHLDASGEKAEVYQAELTLPDMLGDVLCGVEKFVPGVVSHVMRIR